MRFKILEQAELELDDAYDYYEYELEGLGRKYLEEFKGGIKRILNHPRAWSPIREDVRKCILKKFPYNIIYAVAHQHKRPDYWIDRINNL